MLTIYDLNNQKMIEKPDFFELIADYSSFKGVSFVGSFKIIEEKLLPNFRQINLILGMEDSQIGQNLDQLFNVPRKVKEISKMSDEFLNRVENKTLQLRFTKDQLFHSKYFIVENDNNFIIFNGSMNLTQKALNKNHEMMWMYEGNKENKQDQVIYQAHQKLFEKNFIEDSAEYLDRKLIKQIRNQNTKQITNVITDDMLEKADNVVKVHSEDIVQLTSQAKKDQVAYEMFPEATEKIVNNIYTPKGHKRRNSTKIKENVKKIVYKDFSKADDEKVINAESLYPEPMWSHQDEQLVVRDPYDNLYRPLEVPKVEKDDVRVFVEIIKSFKYNKVKDESNQALSAFMYLMTSPLIWKIREIYHQSNFSKSADQVPVSMVLIGRGTTGKTLLVSDYFKKFTGDTSKSIQYSEINGNSAQTNKAVTFLDNYLNSGRFVSPMIIDELNGNFLHSKVATNAIKQWSNTITGIHNVNIFAMNHNAGSKEINNLEEITKRVYYLSFEAPWLPQAQQKYNYNILINDNNDHIYKYVTHELNRRLCNLTGEDEANLVKDYLSITKEIVWNLLKKFGYQNELADIINKNYDYKVDRNRITWKMLIKDDNFEHVSVSKTNPDQFVVSKAIFNNLKANSYENINQTLDNYFNMFPREAGIAIEQYDNGMILNIKKFDKFIGEPLIQKYYDEVYKDDKQQDTMTAFLKAQEKRDEANNQIMQTLVKQVAEQNKPKKKQGLISKLFRK
ncbi:phospholipase D family protein [Lactobacillus sp. PSON]|uniref:phospholipase D family protein n=1 Tax=Lactobacillus sp. PSON TaxID=3455454 RepID=UPI0040419EF8